MFRKLRSSLAEVKCVQVGARRCSFLQAVGLLEQGPLTLPKLEGTSLHGDLSGFPHWLEELRMAAGSLLLVSLPHCSQIVNDIHILKSTKGDVTSKGPH